jgi:aromatic-amino-acid transaminase
MLDQPTKTEARGGAKLLETLGEIQSDSLLKLIALANGDPRPHKIDVGVGVYRDGIGNTPILRALKAAEKLLWERQESKSYIGGFGDIRFAELLRPIVLGRHADDDRIAGLQTPGGCGALSLGFKLIAAASPDATVLVGTPTWPNHVPVIREAGLKLREYGYYDRLETRIRFDQMMAALESASAGDVVLLHGCCHNPTGADLDLDQWRAVVDVVSSRGLLPLVDIAYQGLGRGFAEDAAGLHLLLDACDEVIVAQSCDKNFGVYRDRVGSMFVKTASAEATRHAMSHLAQIARAMWSMPPDHGAAAVRLVLEDEKTRAQWLDELEQMRARIRQVRAALGEAGQAGAIDLSPLARGQGMFATLKLSKEQIEALRKDHGIYMAGSGRINIAGLTMTSLPKFVAALAQVTAPVEA